MTALLHWGKFVNSEEPVTGVISANNINWEFVDDEICLDCEQYLFDVEEDTSLSEEEKEDCRMNLYCFDHTKLFGDWIKDKASGEYEPDKSKEFAAIITDSTFNCVQVVWSKYIAEDKQLCSPCFPGQVDLDSKNGEFKGYTLPDYLIRKEE